MARKTVRKGRKRGGSPGTLAQLVSSQTGGGRYVPPPINVPQTNKLYSVYACKQQIHGDPVIKEYDNEKITKCINELLPTLNGIPYVEKDSYIKRVQKEETNKTHQLHEAARQRTLNAIELRNKQTGGSRRTNKKNTRVRKTKRRS